MTQPRLKHFGWGREGEGLTPAELAFVLGRIEQRFGPPAGGEVKPPRLEDIKLEPPRLEPPASLPFCSTALYDRAAHAHGKSFPEYVRGLARRLPQRAGRGRLSAHRTGSRGGARLGGRRAGERDAVRRRLERRRRSRAAARCGPLQGGGDDRPARAWPRARSRQDLARRAHRGRRVRPGAGGAAQAARADAPSFPAKFRVLDARRLDRDPLGRSFRLALHPHRRSRGIAARHHPEGRDRDAAAARLGRRSKSGPAADRLRRHPRHHHASLDAVAGSSQISRRRRHAVCGLLHRGQGVAGDLSGRIISGELPHPRPAGSFQHRRRRRQRGDHGARLRVRRSSGRTVDGAGARMLRRSRRQTGPRR